ncbi:MAG: YbdD/YjiX family protein [Mycobacterium sp.]
MGRATDIVRQIRWYVGTLMGDRHYQRYLEHRRQVHPGEPVLTEREYWKMRHAGAESNPGARCC